MKKFLILLFELSLSISAAAQLDSLSIENNAVSRKFYFRKDSVGFITKEFINKATKENYVNPATEEFSITINDKLVNGLNCRFLSHSLITEKDTTRLLIRLQTPLTGVVIQLTYQLYADLPVVRKHLQVINNSTSEVVLTNLDVEMLRFQVVHKYQNEVYANYGTHLTRIPYKGDYNDVVIMLYNAETRQGAVFGNEAPGVLKNTDIYTNIHGCIQIGMRHINETFPFKKFLGPGETFYSPGTFIYVFNSSKWTDGFEGNYKIFTRKYLGLRNSPKELRPHSFYCTWLPFYDKISEKLVIESGEKLARSATDIFIVDAGWYIYSGDFLEDTLAFPNGLKYSCDYIRSKGMQPGLWFSVSGVNVKSQVAIQHPDWLVKDKNGNPMNLHDMATYPDGKAWNSAFKNMSLASPYYFHLKKVISRYIDKLQIKYLKLDLAAIVSAYVHDPERSGDFEFNSAKEYKDRASSYWILYERLMQLMDDLHQEFPQLLIDCTFETWGRYNMTDFALFQHADYEWLANIELDSIRGPITIRQMNFDRARVIPNSGFLIGNLYMNAPNYKYAYYSLASVNPAMVGEPVKLTSEQVGFYQKWNSYLKQVENKYQYSQFYQLYDIFDRPSLNNWDGCYRINVEKQGGLMFFYRNSSPDRQRTFKIPCLNPEYSYKIYSHESAKTWGVYSGKFLIEKGIQITLPNPYSSLILTIEKEGEK